MSEIKSDEEYDFDFEEDAKFELIKSLQSKNLARYEYQAKVLLQNFKLTVPGEGFQIEYKLRGDGCSSELTNDVNISRTLGWHRIRPSSQSETKHLIQVFSESEARALLNI